MYNSVLCHKPSRSLRHFTQSWASSYVVPGPPLGELSGAITFTVLLSVLIGVFTHDRSILVPFEFVPAARHFPLAVCGSARFRDIALHLIKDGSADVLSLA